MLTSLVHLSLSLALLGTAATPPIAGGYADASVASPEVSAAAQYAVKAHSESTHKAHRLKRIVSAEQQVVAGMNYKLCLLVGEGRGLRHSHYISAVVYRNLKNEMRLTSWDHSDCL